MTAPAPRDIPAGLLQFLAARGCTPKQSEAAVAFYQLWERLGYSPTYAEWSELLGVARETVFERATALLAKGVLDQTSKHKSRNLCLRWGGFRNPEELVERYEKALRHYAAQAVGGEVAREALEATA